MVVYPIAENGAPNVRGKATVKALVSNERLENAFDAIVYTDANTSYTVTHDAYQTVLSGKVSEWNKKLEEGYFNGKLDDKVIKTLKPGKVDATNAYEVSFWDVWGPTILEIVVMGGLMIFLLTRLGGAGGKGAMDFNKSPARRESSKVRFDDVAGCDEEKEEMVEMVDYLKSPKKYSTCGARLPKGVLLVGPPGTGKTLLAKATAGEAGVPFYSISGSDFVEMFVGVGAGRVRDLFKKAKQTAPCIIFIDEIDAVGRQRGAGLGGGNDEREQTLNQLLVEMDGFAFNAGILVMAATNRDDVLDPALLRPGRFDRIITVNYPDLKGREAIFKVHAKNKKISPDVDFSILAKRTVGFTGADIDNILNEAAILAVRFKKDIIGMDEIEEAIDRRIAGPAKKNQVMSANEKKQIAYHEAGHAIIGLTLPDADKVQKITIVPRGKTGGHVQMMPDIDRFLNTKKQLLAEITGLLGGRASEEIFFEDISTGASNDIERATRIARLMVTEWGMSDLGPIQYEQASGSVFLGRDYTNTQKNFSAEVAQQIDKAVREIIENAHKEALAIIESHKDQVTMIADTLLTQETITSEEIESLVKTGKLPSKDVPAETPAEEPVVAEEPKEEAPAAPETAE
ncbi:MAG: ATP-dependent zinc metalloprotease FtsH [Bacilli bacterium]|nr:ATP-dependent zinc metalloprotease FtsH [Bacilli bacterium]